MNKTENVKLNKIDSVYDADIFRGTINGIPDWLGDNVPFRIYGIDTPEKKIGELNVIMKWNYLIKQPSL